MSDIKTKVQKLDPNISARDVAGMASNASNVYEALAIIGKRANQLQVAIKEELKSKLEEFEVVTDTIEEVQENKEQIEISKFYERLPNPAMIATYEFLNGELTWRSREDISEFED
jgi:DNA-directed RNA polymerase subunit K/omega